MRDRTHMESVERWAQFIRDKPRETWKRVTNEFINSVYQKSDEFYKRLEESEGGRKVLKRLIEERMNAAKKI